MTSAAELLAAKARVYFRDARRLAEVEGDAGGGLTGLQWSIVYRAIATELNRCAKEIGMSTCPGCTEDHLTDQHAPGDPAPKVAWETLREVMEGTGADLNRGRPLRPGERTGHE